ncbi:hypothetical protein BKA56DRAFT_598839, partial [Ilyonectria sp. MPI-CAGE-AT-0026]
IPLSVRGAPKLETFSFTLGIRTEQNYGIRQRFSKLELKWGSNKPIDSMFNTNCTVLRL